MNDEKRPETQQEKLRWALKQLEGAFTSEMVFQHEWSELEDDADAEGIDLSDVEGAVRLALEDATRAGAQRLQSHLTELDKVGKAAH